ncbi:MAG: DUF4126 family protein, partial [Deltaproteobacteria bacterium]
ATGGAGNPFFSTLELAGSVLTALLAIFVPVLCLVLLGLFFLGLLRRAWKALGKKPKNQV